VVAAAYPDEPWRAATATRWSVGFGTTNEEVGGACVALARALATLPLREDLTAAHGSIPAASGKAVSS
jgi:hypothetical protein